MEPLRQIQAPKTNGKTWRERTTDKLREGLIRSHYTHIFKSELDDRDDVTAIDLAKDLGCTLTENVLTYTFTSPLFWKHHNPLIGAGIEQIKHKRIRKRDLED